MAVGSGIGSQLGIVAEVTYNTAVTVTRFYEFTSENINYNKNIKVGLGLRAGGKVPRLQRRVVVTQDVSGDIMLDVPTRGLGLLLSHATGSAPAGTLVSTGVYSYTFTLADTYSKSLTVQVGVPEYNGTVVPKTITGTKITGFEFSLSNAGLLVGKFSIDGAAFVTSTALATASYALAGSIFHFAQAALTIDATPAVNVKDFTLTVDNNVKTDRFNIGAAGAKTVQNINGFRKISGKMTVEFTDSILMDKYLNDAAAALVLTFVGGTIASTYKDTLTFTLPAVKLNADTPNVQGPGVIDLAVTFEAYDDGTNEPLTIFYQTSEATL